MLYIAKIDDYLEILIDEEVKNVVAIDFSEYFKSVREEQNFRKVAKLLYIFLATPDEVEKYVQSNSSDNCVHHYNVEIWIFLVNTKPVIKNKLKELLSELENFKAQAKLVLDYKKRNARKMFGSNAKLIASD